MIMCGMCGAELSSEYILCSYLFGCNMYVKLCYVVLCYSNMLCIIIKSYQICSNRIKKHVDENK